MTVRKICLRWSWELTVLVVLAAAGALLTACDDAIYDDEGDCSVTYRVRFHYDRNIKFADAFASEVGEVALHVFDKSGHLVWQGTESGDSLRADGYSMAVPVPPGDYDMIAWCQGPAGHSSRFIIGQQRSGDRIEDYGATLPTENGVSDADLRPLYHGRNAAVTLPDTYGTVYNDIQLTKNTNEILILLQHTNGEPLDPEEFHFTITDACGSLAHDNTPAAETVTYRPWRVEATQTTIGTEAGGDAMTSMAGLVAEFSTSRLIAAHRPVLTIRTHDHDVVRIPLIDYLMMVKSEYRKEMTDQDYLDRQDDYTMTFFLDPDNNWFTQAGIYINSWHVVLQNEDL